MKSGYDVILKPIITEQSMDMSADKKYVSRLLIQLTRPRLDRLSKKSSELMLLRLIS